jgi:hypothetical protein
MHSSTFLQQQTKKDFQNILTWLFRSNFIHLHFFRLFRSFLFRFQLLLLFLFLLLQLLLLLDTLLLFQTLLLKLLQQLFLFATILLLALKDLVRMTVPPAFSRLGRGWGRLGGLWRLGLTGLGRFGCLGLTGFALWSGLFYFPDVGGIKRFFSSSLTLREVS